MKNHKKLLLLIFGILICISLFFIVQIYAKYLTSASGNTSLKIARWNIIVNNLSIKDNSDISTSIVPTFVENSNISSDIIAPTSEGYFDLDFDFSDEDVSFKYEITTSVDSQSSVSDLVATGYSVDDGQKIDFANFNDPISDTILLDSGIQKRKIRVYILWNDDDATQSMSNADDTASAISDNPAILHVNIAFTQITE